MNGVKDKLSIEELINNVKEYDAKTQYSGIGWFLFTVIGMSARPVKVEFIERESGKVVYSTSDPEVLKKFVGR